MGKEIKNITSKKVSRFRAPSLVVAKEV